MILKLPNVGDTATLDITRCEVVEGQYGEQILFSAGDADLYLPRNSADRQLERIGYSISDNTDYAMIVGDCLTFSRTASNKPGAKPFWDISKAKGNGKPPVAKSGAEQSAGGGGNAGNPANAPPDDVPFPPKPKLTKLYQDATEFVLGSIVPLYEKSKIGCSDQAVAAMVATLYISATKER